MIRRSSMVAMAIFLGLSTIAQAFCQEAEPPMPNYKLNRADEDYRYLQKGPRRDLWDPVKYIPFNNRGDWYLSLGGEARERYEYFDNFNWKEESTRDNGYALQRYFLHGDVHLGDDVRVFGQFQSSLENGRAGGPRPSIDKNELDLHQGFLDLRLPLSENESITLRSGRQELLYGSQRLIAVREGPNVRQAFDGFRVMYRSGPVAVDGIATRPVESNKYVFDDETDHKQGLWGVYSVLPLPSATKANTDLYYLGLYRSHSVYDQGAA
ncbi:MAG: alginate export family protein, partial [Syntrophothermus sp.]